jgi:3-hydroxy-9,10-secoandrosta-1,3,5(10)-triene-9,17-dione monooxygenase
MQDTPTLDALLESARALQPMLKELAPSVEAEGRVSADAMARLKAARLLDVCKPQRWGGLGLGPTAGFEVTFELGRACGSTAWCAGVAICNAWFVSYWPEEAQRDIWGSGEAALVAGTAVPTGKCEAVDGGYLVSGSWPFASNCDNSQWAFISAVLPQDGDRAPDVGWFLTPMSTLRIDHASWNVSGLRGTGSKTLHADQPVFVPSHRVIRFGDIQAGAVPGAQIAGNDMARFYFSTFAAACLVGPLLGMSQGALDCFVETMRSKKRVAMRPGAPMSAADNPFAQERAGRASAAIRAAHALILSDMGAAQRKVFQGETLSVEDRIAVRRSIGFAAGQASAAANSLAEGAGATASDYKNPLQRFWRDVGAGARHVTMDTTAIYAMTGQVLFGMPAMGSH